MTTTGMLTSNSLLLGQSLFGGDGDGSPLFYTALLVILVAVVFFSFVMLLAARYKRCRSNQILVIYGKAGGKLPAKCVHGGAAFVWPLIQDYNFLGLEPLQINIPLQGALSLENIRVDVPSVFTVAIGTSPQAMQNAAIRLLGLNTLSIEEQAKDIIFGQLRQVIASMRIEEINRDRDAFLDKIQSSLEPELQKIGLELINVNVTDITDESGYIEAIGQKAAAQAIQQAKADVADEEKLGAIRVADALKQKDVSVAGANKDREIGTRQAAQLQAVRVAELERDQKVAEEQARFQKEVSVKEAERDARVATSTADSKAVEGENTAQATIAASQAQLQVARAIAFQEGESRKREAEAAVLEIQNRAMAKAAEADAERVEAEKRAQLEAPAKAEKAKMIVDAEASAEQVKIAAEAQATAIFKKLEAEAKGEYEILAKKGEGLKTIVDACGGADAAFQLMMLEHLDNLVEAQALAISKIKFDKVVVWEGGQNGNGKTSTANWLSGLTGTLPPVLELLKSAGINVPESIANMDGMIAERNQRFQESTPAATDDAADVLADDVATTSRLGDSGPGRGIDTKAR